MSNSSPEITDVIATDSTTGEIIDDRQAYPLLSVEEDTFCLAVVECGGNIASAYRMAFGKDVELAYAKGRALTNLPQIALRIRDLTDSIHDASLVSLGAHLQELAEIRDLSKVTGQLKVALAAEQARGEVVGLYKEVRGNHKSSNTPQFNVTFVSKHDSNI